MKVVAAVRPSHGRREKGRPGKAAGLLDKGDEGRRVIGNPNDLNFVAFDPQVRQMRIVGKRFRKRLQNQQNGRLCLLFRFERSSALARLWNPVGPPVSRGARPVDSPDLRELSVIAGADREPGDEARDEGDAGDDGPAMRNRRRRRFPLSARLPRESHRFSLFAPGGSTSRRRPLCSR